MFELLKHLIVLTSEVTEIPTPSWITEMTNLFNSTWGWATTAGVGTIAGIIGVAKTLVPTNNAFVKVTEKIEGVKTIAATDNSRITALEEKLKSYELANDEKVALLALKSPNAKVKDLGAELMKQVEEKKKAIKLPSLDKIEETIKVLKEK